MLILMEMPTSIRLAPARNEVRELHQREHELEEEVSVKHEVSMSEQREVIADRM